MVKDVERYKKFVNSSVTALMIISMLFCWIVLVYHWAYLQTGYFYVVRTRSDILVEIDFEV
jgi:hypothetical protein